MTDQGCNLFDECSARCVYLSPQEEECTSSSWGDSKMFRSGSIANSKRMLTEINNSGTMAKIKIWVESDNVNIQSKVFIIISSKTDDVLVVCIFRE